MSGYTVLILGAGASQAYGFPLGRGLVDAIAAFLPSNDNGRMDEPAMVLHSQLRQDQTLVNAWCDCSGKDLSYALIEFRRRLVESDPKSIDEFLSRDFGPATSVFRQIGKLSIASVIARQESEASFEEVKHDPSRDHWYRYFWQECLNANCRTVDDLRAKRLRIVSFNYDRSLEYFLGCRIAATYLTQPGEALTNSKTKNWHLKGFMEVDEGLQITHPYGTLGSLLTVPYGSTSNAQNYGTQMAQKIRVIGEERQNDEDSFAKANQWIAEAFRVVFLGFSFDPTNMERLGLKSGLTRRRRSESTWGHCAAFPLTYGLERAEREHLRQTYFSEHFPIPGHPAPWDPGNDQYPLSEIHQTMPITQYLRRHGALTKL